MQNFYKYFCIIFSDANFGGNSICLHPEDSEKCDPGFHPSGLTKLNGDILSARKGCF